MSLRSVLRRMSKMNKFVKDRSKHDLVNISDDIRRPSLSKFIVDRIEKVAQSVRHIDIETSVETDFNIKASLIMGALKLLAKENGPFGNLLSVEVIDGATTTAAVEEIQEIAASAVPDAGSFTLEYNSIESAAIAFNEGATELESALQAITGLEAASVSGNFTDGFVINLGEGDFDELAEATNTLEASTVPVTLAISTSQEGSDAVDNSEVAVLDESIRITIDEGTTTFAQVKEAIEASVPASRLISVSVVGTEEDAAELMSQTYLAGGE